MKKAKKILLIVAILALLCTTVVVSISGATATVDHITECGKELDKAEAEGLTLEQKKLAFDNACNYLWDNVHKEPIYWDARYLPLRERFENVLAGIVIEYLDVCAKATDTASKVAAFDVAYKMLSSSQYPSISEGNKYFQQVSLAVSSCAFEVADTYLPASGSTPTQQEYSNARKAIEERIKIAYTYLDYIQPSTEGRAELVDRSDLTNIEYAKIFLMEIRGAASKDALMQKLSGHIDQHPIFSSNPSYAAVMLDFASQAVDLAEVTDDVAKKQQTLSLADGVLKQISSSENGYGELKNKFDALNLGIVKTLLDNATASEKILKDIGLITVKESADGGATTVPGTGTTDDPDTVVVSREEYLIQIFEQISKIPLVNKEDDNGAYEAVMQQLDVEVFNVAKAFVEKFSSLNGTAAMSVMVRRQKSFLKKFTVSETLAGYTEYNTAFEAQQKAYEDAIAKARDEIERKAPIDEFNAINYPTVFSNDFDSKGGSNFGISGERAPADKRGIATESNGNSYYSVEHPVANHPGHHHQLTLSYKPQTKTVYEFDVTTFSGFAGSGITLSAYSSLVTGGNGTDKDCIQFFDLSEKGNLGIAGSGTVAEDIITKGEWTHLAFVFDPVTINIDVYLDYQYIGTYASTLKGNHVSAPSLLYFGSGAAKGTGDYALDNVKVYLGSVPRTEGKLETMSVADKYMYAIETVVNEGADAYTRKTAYEFASGFHGEFWDAAANEGAGGYKFDINDANNAALKAAVDAYNAFDLEVTMQSYRMQTLEGYKALVDALSAVSRGQDTVAQRLSDMTAIDNYLLARHNEIDTTAKADPNDEKSIYELCKDKLAKVVADVENEELIEDFRFNMQLFTASTNLEAMQAAYDRAKDVYNSLELELENHEKFTAFKQALEAYRNADVKFAQVKRTQNAKDVVGYMAQIKEYDTREEWETNYESIKPFVALIRAIVKTGNYDTSVEGFADALAQFNRIEAYFFERFQTEHIAFMEENIEKIRNAGNYIEKMGLCAVVNGYLENADVDTSNETLMALIATYDVYREEIEKQEDVYGTVLKQNTTYFINLAKKLETCVGYNATKAVYDEATVYYFSMNVGTDEAKAAIAVYEKIGAELKAKEDAAAAFFTSVARLVTTDKDGKYGALVECCYYSRRAEAEMPGMNEALALYNAAYAEYNTKIAAVNTDIQSGTDVISSVRAVVGISPAVAAILKKIFG